VEGFPAAQNNLGLMYARGKGVLQNDAVAVTWYRKAAARHYAPAESNLGFMYLQGRGVPADTKEAAKLFRKAAKTGNGAAQYNLGLLYYLGSGVCGRCLPRCPHQIAGVPRARLRTPA
jgi:uncharacterized protein